MVQSLPSHYPVTWGHCQPPCRLQRCCALWVSCTAFASQYMPEQQLHWCCAHRSRSYSLPSKTALGTSDTVLYVRTSQGAHTLRNLLIAANQLPTTAPSYYTLVRHFALCRCASFVNQDQLQLNILVSHELYACGAARGEVVSNASSFSRGVSQDTSHGIVNILHRQRLENLVSRQGRATRKKTVRKRNRRKRKRKRRNR